MSRLRHSTTKLKTKLRLFSLASSRLLPDTSHNDSLAISPCQLISSSCFLTPLDVRDPDHFTPLTDYTALAVGDEILPPPPPPRRKLSYGQEPAPSLSREGGPKVRPFVAGSRLSSNWSLADQVCFICEEPLETKLEQEHLVQLSCGDCLHSECLSTSVDCRLSEVAQENGLNGLSSSVKVEATIFPPCRGSVCVSKNRSRPVAPIDDNIVRQIVDDVMLSLKLSVSTAVVEGGAATTCSLPSGKSSISSDNLKHSYISTSSFGKETSYSFPSTASENSYATTVFSSYEEAKGIRSLDSVLSPQPVRSSLLDPFVLQSHEPAIERESLTTSPALSNFTNATVSVRISLHQLVLLDYLRSSFIRYMVQSNEAIDFSVLVAVGPLRIVDRLQVSTGKNIFSEAMVFLFLNYLVVWRDHHQLRFFDLAHLTRIDSSNACIILLKFAGISDNLEICSDTDSIIQKWGIALSDHSLVFPPELFSSTISVAETSAIRSLSSDPPKQFCAPARNSFVAQVSPILENENESPTPKDVSVLASPLKAPNTLLAEKEALMSQLSRPNSPMPCKVASDDNTVDYYIYSSRPTTPLNIPSFPLIRQFSTSEAADSDLDSDSDEELIQKFTNKHA